MKEIKISMYTKLCLSLNEGKRIRNIIEEILDKGETVILNFSDIKAFASPFFNVSIGYFINKYGPDKYKELVQVKNLSVVGERTYNDVLKNSIQYYYSNKKEKIDEIISNPDD